MSDVNVSFRHLKKLSDLPPKLTRGRIYYVDDVEYVVVDHGGGAVYYGKKDAERLGLLEGRATELEKRATNVEKRATDLESRATNVEKRATDLESRATNVEKRATDLEGRATKVEGRATSLEGRMTTAEGDIDAVENRATALEGRATTLEDRADGHDNADKALQDRATAVEGRAATLESDLNTAKTGLKARMTTAEGNISTNASDIDKLESRATAVEGRATTLEGTTAQHTTDITSLNNNKAAKATTLAGYGITNAYTKTEIDNKLSSTYKPKGSIAASGLTASLLVAANEGGVYNLSTDLTTTANFVEGAGKTYPAGTNVVIINTGTAASPSYKFDVLAGMVDLSPYAEKTSLADTNSKVSALESEDTAIKGRLTTAEGNISTNAGDIATLKSGKADKGTTLSAYGITDAYTKTQTDDNFAKLVYVNPKFEALEKRAGELEVATCYKGAWATGKAYKVHDIVTYNGNVYICCAAHTSSTGTAPGSTYNWLAMTSNVPTDVFGYNSVGLHNSIYRGKNLGTVITDEQWAEIKAGRFRDLWLGDHWNINYDIDIPYDKAYCKEGQANMYSGHPYSMKVIIMGFNYANFSHDAGRINNANHIYVKFWYKYQYFDFAKSDVLASQGFEGSNFYTKLQPYFLESFSNALGESHIYTYNDTITTSPTVWKWTTSNITAPGLRAFMPQDIEYSGSSDGNKAGIFKDQFPIFKILGTWAGMRLQDWGATFTRDPEPEGKGFYRLYNGSVCKHNSYPNYHIMVVGALK